MNIKDLLEVFSNDVIEGIKKVEVFGDNEFEIGLKTRGNEPKYLSVCINSIGSITVVGDNDNNKFPRTRLFPETVDLIIKIKKQYEDEFEDEL